MREGMRGKRSAGGADSPPSREPYVGPDPRTPGPSPETKAAAQRTEPPRRPED